MSDDPAVLVSVGAGFHVRLDEDVADLMNALGVRVSARRHPRDGVVVQAIHKASRSTIKLDKLVSGADDTHWAYQLQPGPDFTRSNLRIGGGRPQWRNEGWRSKFPVDIRACFAELVKKGAMPFEAPQESSG